GENITIDISKKLQNENYDAIRQIVYKINPKSLSKEVIFNLKSNTINNIALFSQDGVRVFFNLCKKENIDLSNKKIICFSDNIRNFCQKLSLEQKFFVKEVTSIF
ncbi:MAG: uroporphyrinogen-III synthase, partial [Rickettsiales bacterium]